MRVANELGRGDAGAVKFAIKVLMGTSVTIGLVVSIVCLVFSKKIGYLFTNDEAVVQSVDDLSLLLALTVFLGSIYPVLSGCTISISHLYPNELPNIKLMFSLHYLAGVQVWLWDRVCNQKWRF